MSWFRLDPFAVPNNVIIIQLVIPWQLQKWAWKFTCNFENVPTLLTLSPTITSKWLLGQDWYWCFRPRERNTWTGGRFLLACAGGYAHGHFLLCDCEDYAGSVMWGNHEKNLQEGTTFWGCLMIFRVWQGHCLYSINTKLMLLGNSTHERSRKLPDMPNMTSAKCSNCRLHNIIFQRKRTGERRGWKHRAEEISKALMDYRRTDNIGMTNISAEGGRACQSICKDCTTKLSEAAFKKNGVHIFPLPISLSACIQSLLALFLPLTPWKLEASSPWKFQGLAGLTTLPRKLHWSTSLFSQFFLQILIMLWQQYKAHLVGCASLLSNPLLDVMGQWLRNSN